MAGSISWLDYGDFANEVEIDQNSDTLTANSDTMTASEGPVPDPRFEVEFQPMVVDQVETEANQIPDLSFLKDINVSVNKYLFVKARPCHFIQILSR